MSNEKITHDMSVMEMLLVMAESEPGRYNPGALSVLRQLATNMEGFMRIFTLDSLGIRGSNIWMLYSDCCGKNMEKFNRTLNALRLGAYSQVEIQANFESTYAIPFLDDSIQIEGVPSYGEEFGPFHEKWNEYIKANRELVIPRIHERMKAKNSRKR